jgi:hypothetical protein
MHGFIRAIARMFVMAFVMAAVLTAAIVAGVATTTAIALGVVVAGVVGLVSVARRRPRPGPAAHEMQAFVDAAQAARPAHRGSDTIAVEAMAPRRVADLDPEANMPRWRRPSLLEARRRDPTRDTPIYRLPMRFVDELGDGADVRIVRYAVVPVLDRPDEVLGLRVSDLASGDEVEVRSASEQFLEVLCPNGDRGWVHRTTLGQPGQVNMSSPQGQDLSSDAEDALTALLTARGLI